MKNKNSVVKVIILAAGHSKRMKLTIPKQLVKINHKPLTAYTLDVFEKSRLIDGIILVVPQKYLQQFHHLLKKYRYKKIEQVVLGGETRQQSVFNALKKIQVCDYVIIHDGVRPLISQRIIPQIIQAVKKYQAVTTAVKAIDTIVEAKDDYIDSSLCRNKLWHIQTPQAFKLSLILKAHQKAKAKKIVNVSDDAQLVLQLGKTVKLIRGSCQNIKVTTKPDLTLFRELKNSRR